MPMERRDSASIAGTFSVHLTKHLHCFFELPGKPLPSCSGRTSLFSVLGSKATWELLNKGQAG